MRSFVFLTVLAALTQAGPNMGCILGKCLMPLVKCGINSDCRSMFGCFQECGDDEVCQAVCTFRYDRVPQAIDFIGCAGVNKCISGEAEKCPLPQKFIEHPPLSLFIGDWFVVRGLNPVYDRFKCQRMFFDYEHSTRLNYTYTFNVAENMHRTIHCSVEPKDKYLLESYKVLSKFDGFDDWYVVDRIKDYMLIYYCGYGDISLPYQGGIVISRNEVEDIPLDILHRFEAALNEAQVGVKLPQFQVIGQCQNDNKFMVQQQ